MNKNERGKYFFDVYMKERRKGLWLFFAISVLFMFVAYGLMAPRNNDYALISGVIMIPAVVKSWLIGKAARKYAEKMVKQGGVPNI